MDHNFIIWVVVNKQCLSQRVHCSCIVHTYTKSGLHWLTKEYILFYLFINAYIIWVLGQNGSGQNGTDKMVWTKWYTDKMVRTKWYG